MNLIEWAERHNLDVVSESLGGAVISIAGAGVFCEVNTKGGTLFNTSQNRFDLIVSRDEEGYVNSYGVTHYAFSFGGQYYYTPVGEINDVKLAPLKGVGKRKSDIGSDFFIPLGIHGKYELFNGTKDYSAWCDKALFLGHSALGVCEKNTLAGVVAHQLACVDKGLGFIIGETITISTGSAQSDQVDGKVYVLNKEGWANLLRINKHINIDNEGFIYEKDLLGLGAGLVFVYSPEASINDKYSKAFDKVFFQIDPVEYDSDSKERDHLTGMRGYLDNHLNKVDPIIINDAYYLDKDDYPIKKILNIQGNVKFQYSSKDQYYKNEDDNFKQLAKLFNQKDDRLFEIYEKGLASTIWVKDNANFEIELGKLRLPNFDLKGLPTQYRKIETNEDLFWQLISEGANKKIPKERQNDEFWDRVDVEAGVILKGGFVDYFLILWDIIRWCDENHILTGVGRGSSGGSMISYLLGITKINPFDYGLLFERFLNESRIKSSLPDIDVDFEGRRRGEVKKYMEEKHGINSVCSVGTFTTLQLKAAVKELARHKGIPFPKMNRITTILDVETGEWDDLFLNAFRKREFKEFIQENIDMINMIPLCLGQPKSASVHACATLIVPKEDENKVPMTIYDWIPLRKTDDGMLVSEWEGPYLESAGFLKEDILGIKQLDKIRMIFDLVESTAGKRLSIDTIPLDDSGVYDLFCQGYNEDVFHFGSPGLIGYSQEVQPRNIDELIAMNALYRPGAMASQAHSDYVAFKFNRKTPEYDFGLESVVKDTYGLYIFQEQVMQACQVLAGFDLVEADGVRKAMGKKNAKLLESYKERFVESAIKRGCPDVEAEYIWGKLEKFSGYGFNKSHATAYSITGYSSQWLKHHYPAQFWVTAFQFAEKNDVYRYLSELHVMGNPVTIEPPDINNSEKGFVADFDKKIIFWSIAKIKQVGDVATAEILNDRDENGKFFTLEEFYVRVNKSKVNKRVIENLILAGCFDSLYKIKNAPGRKKILIEFYGLINQDLPERYNSDLAKEGYFWTLLQKEISQLGEIDYKKLIKESDKIRHFTEDYMNPIKIKSRANEGKAIVTGGLVVDWIERVYSKRGGGKGKFCRVMLENNGDLVWVIFRGVSWDSFRDQITKSKGKLLLVNGEVDFNQFQNENVLQTTRRTHVVLLGLN